MAAWGLAAEGRGLANDVAANPCLAPGNQKALVTPRRDIRPDRVGIEATANVHCFVLCAL